MQQYQSEDLDMMRSISPIVENEMALHIQGMLNLPHATQLSLSRLANGIHDIVRSSFRELSIAGHECLDPKAYFAHIYGMDANGPQLLIQIEHSASELPSFRATLPLNGYTTATNDAFALLHKQLARIGKITFPPGTGIRIPGAHYTAN